VRKLASGKSHRKVISVGTKKATWPHRERKIGEASGGPRLSAKGQGTRQKAVRKLRGGGKREVERDINRMTLAQVKKRVQKMPVPSLPSARPAEVILPKARE